MGKFRLLELELGDCLENGFQWCSFLIFGLPEFKHPNLWKLLHTLRWNLLSAPTLFQFEQLTGINSTWMTNKSAWCKTNNDIYLSLHSILHVHLCLFNGKKYWQRKKKSKVKNIESNWNDRQIMSLYQFIKINWYPRVCYLLILPLSTNGMRLFTYKCSHERTISLLIVAFRISIIENDNSHYDV